MLQISQLLLPVDHTPDTLRREVMRTLKVKDADLVSITLKQRAIDARRGHVQFSLTVLVEVKNEPVVLARCAPSSHVAPAPIETYQQIHGTIIHQPAKRPVIVGSGPCGLFCALLLARAGWKPILLERGKAAGDRARDVTGFWRRGWGL
jgi:uncharacterized FAD-dependent dehydrogenase